MAGDWIKMRVWIGRDPKVVFMADWLAEQRAFMDWLTDPVRQHCGETAYEHVTRNVTVALCVNALLVTWGTAREQGMRDGDDLVVDFCDLDALSEVCGVPYFGDAMAFIGWAIEEDGKRVRFPKFFVDKVSPEERHRATNAARQQRYRDNHQEKQRNARNGARNGKVTPREEKRREEKKVRKNTCATAHIEVRDDVNAIYSAYPKKADAKRAKLAIARALESVPFADLLEAVQAFAKSDRGMSGQFCPYPATWFNGERWNDDRSTWNDRKPGAPRIGAGQRYDPTATTEDDCVGRI